MQLYTTFIKNKRCPIKSECWKKERSAKKKTDRPAHMTSQAWDNLYPTNDDGNKIGSNNTDNIDCKSVSSSCNTHISPHLHLHATRTQRTNQTALSMDWWIERKTHCVSLKIFQDSEGASWVIQVSLYPVQCAGCHNAITSSHFGKELLIFFSSQLIIHSFSILPDDRFKASSKTIPPHSAI
jgi:hypothetical protein